MPNTTSDSLTLRLDVMFDALARATSAAVFLLRAGSIIYANPGAELLTGFDGETLLRMPLTSLFHPDCRLKVGERIMARQGREDPPRRHQFKILARGGETRWVDFTSDTVDQEWEPVGIVTLTDSTDHHEGAAVLLDAEQRYAEIFENSVEGIYQCRVDGALLTTNPSLARILGYSSPRELHEAVAEVAGAMFAEPARHHELLSALREAGAVQGFEAELVRRDGRRIGASMNANAVFDETMALVSYNAFIQDITEHRILERRLGQAQKMEAIGRLAGGVAHDFNNILTVLMGYSESLIACLPEGSESMEAAREIKNTARRASLLTRQLLAFSRHQITQPVELDVNLVIRGMRSMLGRLLGEDVELHMDPGPSDAWVKADPQQLEQIVMNLAVNARDAMPGGGTITIATRLRDVTQVSDEGPLAPRPGSFIEVAVSDTGSGMPAEILGQIFEPFFTTKPVGQGTGLGLSTVYGIVEQSRGFITVESIPGRGSCFRIALPRVASAERPDERGGGALRDGEGQAILVVEDDPVVRRVAVSVLRGARYEVFEAVDGEDGYALVDQRQGRFDLVLSDVVMPRRGGREMADRIKTRYPALRVLFMSGYSREEPVDLGKPFTREELLRAVQNALPR